MGYLKGSLLGGAKLWMNGHGPPLGGGCDVCMVDMIKFSPPTL